MRWGKRRGVLGAVVAAAAGIGLGAIVPMRVHQLLDRVLGLCTLHGDFYRRQEARVGKSAMHAICWFVPLCCEACYGERATDSYMLQMPCWTWWHGVMVLTPGPTSRRRQLPAVPAGPEWHNTVASATPCATLREPPPPFPALSLSTPHGMGSYRADHTAAPPCRSMCTQRPQCIQFCQSNKFYCLRQCTSKRG